MSILVAINHKTEYRFDRPVGMAPHSIRLRPAPHCRTPIRSYSLRIEPEDHFINWQQDPFGNYLARLVLSAGIAMVLGVVSGLMPARRAGRLDCVEAMRSE